VQEHEESSHYWKKQSTYKILLQRRTQQFSIEEHAHWLTETKLAYLLTAPSVLAGMLDVYESGAVAPASVGK
jgi:hypothetical protein